MAESFWLGVPRDQWAAVVAENLPRMQKSSAGQAVYLTTWQAQQAKVSAGTFSVPGSGKTQFAGAE